MYYVVCVDAPKGRGTFGTIWMIEKHCKTGFWGLGKMVSCTEGWTDLNDLYVI